MSPNSWTISAPFRMMSEAFNRSSTVGLPPMEAREADMVTSMVHFHFDQSESAAGLSLM